MVMGKRIQKKRRRAARRRRNAITAVDSPQLAEAVECAYDQEAPWAFYDLLFETALNRAGDAYGVAERVGLDQALFQECYDSRRYRGLVEAQLRDALGHGFRGTPSFIVNDTPLAGPPTFEFLVSIIESYLVQENP